MTRSGICFEVVLGWRSHVVKFKKNRPKKCLWQILEKFLVIVLPIIEDQDLAVSAFSLFNYLVIQHLTVILGQDNEWLPKWTLFKITVNLAPKWPLIRKNHYQIDRYFQPKWPLFKPKLPLYVVRKLTVILVEKTVQNDRYLYQCDSFQMLLVSFPTKMTDNLLTHWITVILVPNNGTFGE